MTTSITIIVAVLLVARVLYLTHKRLTNPPKYKLGDRVRFVHGIADAYVTDGEIWKVHKYWLMETAYEIYNKIGTFSGSN